MRSDQRFCIAMIASDEHHNPRASADLKRLGRDLRVSRRRHDPASFFREQLHLDKHRIRQTIERVDDGKQRQLHQAIAIVLNDKN
jgi:hypothetical protein